MPSFSLVPKVSVLIAVYNGAADLGRALSSVESQSFDDYELIVLDDGSSDRSADIACSFARVSLIRQTNQGIGAARQRLLSEASGEWVAFLDHDDEWAPAYLERMVAETDDPTTGLIYCGYVEVTSDGNYRRQRMGANEAKCALDHLLPDNRIGTSASLHRRCALIQAGGFPLGSSRAEDWSTWFRVAKEWDIREVEATLVKKHERGLSASTPDIEWYRAERRVLAEELLPDFDEKYRRHSESDRKRIRRAAIRKLAVIDSLEARCHDHGGSALEARRLHLEAIRRSPMQKGAWVRLIRHFLRI